jgi:hypothetical protein
MSQRNEERIERLEDEARRLRQEDRWRREVERRDAAWRADPFKVALQGLYAAMSNICDADRLTYANHGVALPGLRKQISDAHEAIVAASRMVEAAQKTIKAGRESKGRVAS